MIKKIFLLQLIFLFSLFAKASVGDWTLHTSFHNITHCEVAKDKVYVLASGSLFSYNNNDNEVMVYDKMNCLSDIDITHIAYSDYINALVIIYSNTNIDILYDDETIYNVTDFKNSNVPNKKITNINIKNNSAYLSTEFGVVVLDLEKLEIRNTYSTGYKTLCAYPFKDKLYTGTNDGLLKCDTTKNLLDKNNWENINSNKVEAICELDNKLYVLIKDKGIFTLNTTTNELTQVIAKSGEKYYTIYNVGDEIVAPAKDKVTIINKKGNITYKTSNSTYIFKDGDDFWNCKGYKGLYKSKIEDKNCLSPLLQ